MEDRLIDKIVANRQATYLIPQPGGDIVRACIDEIVRLRNENTSATDPLMKRMEEEAEKMKEELKRLYIERDERNFAYMADDSVPRLVFNASIDAIANKDLLLKRMADALEDALRVCEWGEPQPKPVAKRIAQALQKYLEATCQQEKK